MKGQTRWGSSLCMYVCIIKAKIIWILFLWEEEDCVGNVEIICKTSSAPVHKKHFTTFRENLPQYTYTHSSRLDFCVLSLQYHLVHERRFIIIWQRKLLHCNCLKAGQFIVKFSTMHLKARAILTEGSLVMCSVNPLFTRLLILIFGL